MLTEMECQCEFHTIQMDGVEQPAINAMEKALDKLLCTPLDYRRPADVTRDLFTGE